LRGYVEEGGKKKKEKKAGGGLEGSVGRCCLRCLESSSSFAEFVRAHKDIVPREKLTEGE